MRSKKKILYITLQHTYRTREEEIPSPLRNPMRYMYFSSGTRIQKNMLVSALKVRLPSRGLYFFLAISVRLYIKLMRKTYFFTSASIFMKKHFCTILTPDKFFYKIIVYIHKKINLKIRFLLVYLTPHSNRGALYFGRKAFRRVTPLKEVSLCI